MMAFDANDLSPHEHFVVERTNAGEIASFQPWATPAGQADRAGGFQASCCCARPELGHPVRPASASRAGSKACSTDCSGEGLPLCRWSRRNPGDLST